MTTTSTLANEHRVVSREAWLKERLALLNEEKKITRQQDAIAEKVRDRSTGGQILEESLHHHQGSSEDRCTVEDLRV